MVDTYLAALSEKHANLESQINQEVHRPLPDELLIAQWKKEKLRLKEVIAGIR
ncbi:YdcH family protein [Sphingosinicella sp.]|uniref:YdcH family protein n=1 Tax=Sphingosinicella xenopeptidilytica TaxID=364098 RepID=A0ABW3C6E5_SPHXN|nr:YdcH family protein [Sphingosinicella sp.]